MELIVDGIIVLENGDSILKCGVKKEEYQGAAIKNIIGKKIAVQGNSNEKLILDVKDVKCSISFSGDIVIAIKVIQNLDENAIQSRSKIYSVE